MQRNYKGHNDWMDHPAWERFFAILRFIWPAVAFIGILLLIRLAWGFGPLVFGVITIGMIYLIMKLRWAMDISKG